MTQDIELENEFLQLLQDVNPTITLHFERSTGICTSSC